MRWLLAFSLLAATVLLFVEATEFRSVEARTLATWFGPLISGGINVNQTHFFVHAPDVTLLALNITMECTALLLIAPLTIMCVLMLMFTKTTGTRIMLALVAAVTVTFIVNQLRLAVIAGATRGWGMTGYEIGHRFIGSLLALGAFASGFLIILIIMFNHPTTSTAPQPHTD